MSAKKELIDRRQARAWMVMNNIRVKDIQKALGYRFHSPIVGTLQGERSSRDVLTWLRDNGCPVEYLQLPSTMQGDA